MPGAWHLHCLMQRDSRTESESLAVRHCLWAACLSAKVGSEKCQGLPRCNTVTTSLTFVRSVSVQLCHYIPALKKLHASVSISAAIQAIGIDQTGPGHPLLPNIRYHRFSECAVAVVRVRHCLEHCTPVLPPYSHFPSHHDSSTAWCDVPGWCPRSHAHTQMSRPKRKLCREFGLWNLRKTRFTYLWYSLLRVSKAGDDSRESQGRNFNFTVPVASIFYLPPFRGLEPR